MAKGIKTGGRKAGTPNKNNKELKEMILGALSAKRGQAWLEQQMDENPTAFMSLLGKILPQQMKSEITGKDGGPLKYEQVIRTIVDPQEK